MPFGLPKYVRQIIKLITVATLVFYVLSCATVISPTGGPKDITPPKMVSSQPKNLSTNFNGNKLIINFDEYVQLKSPEKFLLISPPLSELPDIKEKGRSIVIKIKDTLRRNTTYSFYLGEAIVDLTESNPVPNFNFAFSTGPEIDSLSLSGNVTDALSRMPVKGAYVELYKDFTDSVPMKEIPTYVSRTNEKGNFHFTSLASGKYRAVALLDGNNDYKYDLPSEMIGFSSDSVEPYYNAVNLYDTVAVKKADMKQEKLISINIFSEPDSTQRILKSVISALNKLSVAFRYPTRLPVFRPLNMPDSVPWAILEWNHTNDTLGAWLLNKPDTLKLEVSDQGRVIDTIRISTTLKVTGKPRKAASSIPLGYSTSLSNKILGYNKPLLITFINPLKTWDFGALQGIVLSGKDTSTFTPVVRFTDSIRRHLSISYKWISTDKYNIYIPKSTFTDIYSDTCDSTHVTFQMKPIEEYGTLAFTINRTDSSYPVIIQLLSEKGLVIDQRIVSKEKKADFGLLPPGKYGVKAIMDENGNGKWDTGRFLKKIQPERVLVHPKIFDVKANWEVDETWDL